MNDVIAQTLFVLLGGLAAIFVPAAVLFYRRSLTNHDVSGGVACAAMMIALFWFWVSLYDRLTGTKTYGLMSPCLGLAYLLAIGLWGLLYRRPGDEHFHFFPRRARARRAFRDFGD